MPDSPQAVWNELCAWLNLWYHEPDMEALQVCLCSLLSHFYPDEDPMWTLVIGPSGSGKTDIVANSLANIPGAQIIGDLTPKCFLSGMQNAKEEASMLIAGGESQLWISKDFTPFVSLRYEDRALVASHLRDVWDGSMTSNTGAGRRVWKGKVTFLAVATPEFEDHWAALRGLGERFVTLRWRAPESRTEINEKRRQSAGQRTVIREQVRQYVQKLFEGRWQANTMPTVREMRELDATAELVCWLQTNVARHSDRDRSVKRRPEREMSTRLGFALSQVVRTFNDVFHGAPGAVNLAKRLALDTIPSERREVLEAIPQSREFSYAEIQNSVRIPRTTLRRTIEDLVWAGILEFPDGPEKPWTERKTALTPAFRRVLVQSLVFLPKSRSVTPIRQNIGHKASFL